jgi:hypothetical protein
MSGIDREPVLPLSTTSAYCEVPKFLKAISLILSFKIFESLPDKSRLIA